MVGKSSLREKRKELLKKILGGNYDLEDLAISLPEPNRIIAIKYFFEGKSVREMAPTLSMSESKVRRCLRQATFLLKEQYNPKYFDAANQILYDKNPIRISY